MTTDSEASLGRCGGCGEHWLGEKIWREKSFSARDRDLLLPIKGRIKMPWGGFTRFLAR